MMSCLSRLIPAFAGMTTLIFTNNLFATTDQQAFRQQQILQQQQEQQRQFQEQQQNINEIRNIRDSRVKEGVVEDSNTPVRPVVAQNKCDVGYNECINLCNQLSQSVIPVAPSVIPAKAGIQKQDEDCSKNVLDSCFRRNDNTTSKAQCLQQCTQTRTDCISELESTCPYRFNQIILKGNEVYSTKTLNKKIVNKFLNKCISKTNITDLQSKLTNFYINNGYTMARIYFDTKNMTHEKLVDKETGKPVINQKTGKEEVKTTFIVIIEEGIVNSIKLDVERKQKQTKKEKKLAKLFGKYKTLQTQYEKSRSELENDKLEKEKLQNQIKTLESQLEKLALQVKKENQEVSRDSRFRGNDRLGFWTRSRRSMQTAFAFPFKQDRVFNMRDFEQGLDQMNRLQSNSITMSVEPTTDVGNKGGVGAGGEGYTDVLLINNQDPTKGGVATGNRTTFLTAGVNNSGNKSTGENVLNLSLSQDNLISINDNIYISYTDSSFLNGNNKVNKDSNSNNQNNQNPFRNSLDFFNNDNEKLHYNKSLYSSISFPIGYWTINNSINYSTYKTTNTGANTTFHTTGQTITQSYSLDRVMYRTQTFKINAGTTLEIRDTESYIRDLKSNTGSKKTSNGSIYLNNTIFTKYGTIIIKPSYQRGLSWFGSKMDEGVYGTKDVDKKEMHLQYDLVKLYVYYNTRLNLPLLTKTITSVIPASSSVIPASSSVIPASSSVIPAKAGIQKQNEKCSSDALDSCFRRNDSGSEDRNEIKTTRNKLPISYTLTADSQYSFNTLYNKDQFSVGGEYTVRGFRESAISGDNGFYFRNDLRVNMYQLMPNILTNNKVMNYNTIFFTRESPNSLLSKTSLSIFYDYGYVRNKYNDTLQEKYNARSSYLSGFGVGLSYNGNYLNWSLTYSKALHSPNYLQTRDGLEKENQSLYWRVGGNF